MTSFDLSFEQIAALIDREIAPAEREALLARVAASQQHAATLAWIGRVAELMRADTGFDAPASVRARATQLMAGRMPLPRAKTRVGGVLRFDSRSQPRAFGIRSGRTAARQLLFQAGERDIDLRVTPGGEGFTVAGQILGPEEPGTATLRGAASTVEAPLNELAEFVLPPVPAGTYTLLLTLESAEIALEDVDVGALE